MKRMRTHALHLVAILTGVIFTFGADSMGLEAEQFEAVNLGNGSVRFSIKLAHKKSRVQLIAQRNGVEDFCQDITPSGVRNSDGTWSYTVTRSKAYGQNDIIVFRFLTSVPGIEPVCYPHGQHCSVASDYEWSEPFLYSLTYAPDDSLLHTVSDGHQTSSGVGNRAD